MHPHRRGARVSVDDQRRLIEERRRRGARNTILHICGDVRDIVHDCALTGTNLIDVDWMVDVGELVQGDALRDAGITARGNLNPAGVLLSENPEDVVRECRRLIEASKPHGRFILSAGCNISPASVPDNLRAMVRAAETFGRFGTLHRGRRARARRGRAAVRSRAGRRRGAPTRSSRDRPGTPRA